MTEGGKRLRLYRHKGLWGGAAIGAIIGALCAGPFLSSWTDPFSKYLAAISLLSAIGARCRLLLLRNLHSACCGRRQRGSDIFRARAYSFGFLR